MIVSPKSGEQSIARFVVNARLPKIRNQRDAECFMNCAVEDVDVVVSQRSDLIKSEMTQIVKIWQNCVDAIILAIGVDQSGRRSALVDTDRDGVPAVGEGFIERRKIFWIYMEFISEQNALSWLLGALAVVPADDVAANQPPVEFFAVAVRTL